MSQKAPKYKWLPAKTSPYKNSGNLHVVVVGAYFNDTTSVAVGAATDIIVVTDPSGTKIDGVTVSVPNVTGVSVNGTPTPTQVAGPYTIGFTVQTAMPRRLLVPPGCSVTFINGALSLVECGTTEDNSLEAAVAK